MKKSVKIGLVLLGVCSAFWLSPSMANEKWMNNNGHRHVARYLFKRIDVNDDGRIGPREARYAGKIWRIADVNNNGRLGPHERRLARRMLNQSDRRR